MGTGLWAKAQSQQVICKQDCCCRNSGGDTNTHSHTHRVDTPSAPNTHRNTLYSFLPVSLLRGKNAFKSALLSPKGPLSTHPFMTHSRLSSLPLPNSLSSHPSIPHCFPCCLVLSESQSTAHPAHKLTPGNPSMTLRALTTEKRSQHQQQWKKNKREVKKTTTTKKNTRNRRSLNILFHTVKLLAQC